MFPLEPLRPELVGFGFPPSTLEGWFAAGLRDGFALAVAGDFKPFARVLEEALNEVAAEHGLDLSATDRASLVKLMDELEPRPDAHGAFQHLADAGIEVLALSNGSPATTKRLLEAANLSHRVKHVVSIEDVKLSKPRPEVYLHAAKVAGVHPGQLALIAAHPWDVNGAKAAGLITGYLDADRPFSAVMRKPDAQGASLSEVAAALVGH